MTNYSNKVTAGFVVYLRTFECMQIATNKMRARRLIILRVKADYSTIQD